MKLDPCLRYFVSGATQSGKSTWTKVAAASLPSCIIWDVVKREFGHLGTVVTDLNGLNAAVSAGKQKIVIQTTDASMENFDQFCGYINRHLRRTTFIADEIHLVTRKSMMPPEFMRLISTGQGEPFRIGFIGTSQRPANVHNDIIGNATVKVAFRAAVIHDAKAIEATTGIPAKALLTLPMHHFWVHDPRSDPANRQFAPLRL